MIVYAEVIDCETLGVVFFLQSPGVPYLTTPPRGGFFFPEALRFFLLQHPQGFMVSDNCWISKLSYEFKWVIWSE